MEFGVIKEGAASGLSACLLGSVMCIGYRPGVGLAARGVRVGLGARGGGRRLGGGRPRGVRVGGPLYAPDAAHE